MRNVHLHYLVAVGFVIPSLHLDKKEFDRSIHVLLHSGAHEICCVSLHGAVAG